MFFRVKSPGQNIDIGGPSCVVDFMCYASKSAGGHLEYDTWYDLRSCKYVNYFDSLYRRLPPKSEKKALMGMIEKMVKMEWCELKWQA